MSLVSLFIWLLVNNSNQNILFGRVTDISASTITIANRQNNLVIISIATSTRVTSRRDYVATDDITVGSFIQVTAIQGEDSMLAKSIRLMSNSGEGVQHGANQ